MNAISNLSKKNLKVNKTKNILVIIAVVLSTCLITAVGILGYSIQKASVDRAIKNSGGNFHGIYNSINEKQFNILKNNRKIEIAGENIGFDDITFSDKSYPEIALAYFDSNAAKMSNIKIESGKFPEKNNEIAMESWVIRKFNVKPKVGQSIHIKNKDFVLSAILKDNEANKEEHIHTVAIVSKKLVLKNIKEPKINCYVRIKGVSESEVINIGREIGIDNKNINANDMYIKSLGIDANVIIPVVIVGIIVLLSAIMVIYNIFYVSVGQRIKQYGLLKSIGATKKQIRRNILQEGILLSLIGIPIGIILGHIISFAIVPLFSIKNLSVKSSPYIILISIAVSLLTIVISLRKPGKFASKISPVEAMGYNSAKISSKRKERKSSKKVSVSKMAGLNLTRNKKRTIITILSLTMSGILLIIVCSILGSIDIKNLTKQDLKYEFLMRSSSEKDVLNSSLLKEIKRIDGVTDVNTDKTAYGTTENNYNGGVYGYNDKILNCIKKYITNGEFSIEDLKTENKIILVCKENLKYKYKVGDKVKLKVNKIDEYSHKITKSTAKEFVISAISSKNFDGSGSNDDYSFIMHKDTFTREFNEKKESEFYITIDYSKINSVRKSIKQVLDDNSGITCISQSEMEDLAKKQYGGMEVAAASLVGIIALIGIVNLVNTMITSVFSRKKEFGMLQAVGLSDSQLRKMLQMEGIYYSGISIAASAILGTGIGYLCFKLFKKVATYAEYSIPIIPIVLFSLTIIVIQILLTFTVNKILKKESIVERIRYNE